MDASSSRRSRAFALLALAGTSTAAFICDPSTCLNGTNGLSAGASLPGLQLLPGLYTLGTAPFTQTNNSFSPVAISGAVASTGFVTSRNGAGVTVSQPAGIVLYPMQTYQGAANFTAIVSRPNVSTVSNTSAVAFLQTDPSFAVTSSSYNGTLSFLLSSGLQAVLEVPTKSGSTQRIVAYDSVADVTQWGFSAIGGLTVDTLEGAGCTGGCGVGGTCSAAGSCVCAEGFAGPRCDTCASGFFGSNCTPCDDCTDGKTCDDSVTGSGLCLAPPAAADTSLALSTCNCLNGVCNGSKSCTCSPGWTTASNGTLCATCAPGFFQDAEGECVACSSGCLQCSSPLGACTTCSAGLQVSKADSTACEPAPFTLAGSTTSISACSPGFFNANSTTCAPCDPACDTCSSAGPSGCTKCKGGKGLFVVGSAGNSSTSACVNVDSSTGVCTNPTSSAGTAVSGLFLFNTAKGLCDAALRFCTSANLPTPSSSNFSSVVCTACCDGAFLNDGRCLSTCPAGTFASNGQCVECDASCGSCDGSATTCTSCKDPTQSLNAGQCVYKCPAGTFSTTSPSNSTLLAGAKTCLSCSSSCGSCDGSPTSCTSCPPSRPVLDSTAKTCSSSCGRTSFFDYSSNACRTCDASCASCSGPSGSDCLSCKDGTTLQGGRCVPANCAGARTTVSGFGVCLETLLTVSEPPEVTSQPRRRLPLFAILLIVLAILLLLAALLAWWRIKEMRKRREKTQQFGNEVYNRSTDLKLKQLHLSFEPVENPPTFNVPLTPQADRRTMQPTEKVLAWSRSGSPASSRPSSIYSNATDPHTIIASYTEGHLRPSPSRHALPIHNPSQRSLVADRYVAPPSTVGSHYTTDSQAEAASLHRSVSERLAAGQGPVERQVTGGSEGFRSNNPFRR